MRIAFAGASGTGKTSLAVEIAKILDLPLCPIGSRDTAASMGFSNPYDVDEAGRRYEFQQKLLHRKRDWEAQHEAFITDRTHVDNAVYTMQHGAWDQKDFIAYANAMLRYTHIFVTPMASVFKLGDDPMRQRSESYHEHFEALLFKTMPKMVARAPITIIMPSTMKERVEFVLKALNVYSPGPLL